jgi:hypothetical protein
MVGGPRRRGGGSGDAVSAETLLHCGIYRRFLEAGAVLHGHSIANTVLSRACGPVLPLAGYELLKVFPGLPTHDATVEIPVVPNDQDIARMQRGLDALWDGLAQVPPGYLIRGHGSYVWAPDMKMALARMEGLEVHAPLRAGRKEPAMSRLTVWDAATDAQILVTEDESEIAPQPVRHRRALRALAAGLTCPPTPRPRRCWRPIARASTPSWARPAPAPRMSSS